MAGDSGGGCLLLAAIGVAAWWFYSDRGCADYASEFSCSYVREDAEYEVWYWRHLDRDNEADNTAIGRAIGIEMCEQNARAFARAIGEPWDYRAYICVLMKDGRREKHRNLD